ncbi:hypothetical protein R1flu_004689 [Riccia fluitans]|uniref:ATP synthase CF1 alpha subunit n=1 Tax=Riccia fluitans TaxID=41844 RepID=A0ABD1YRE0_9MARC
MYLEMERIASIGEGIASIGEAIAPIGQVVTLKNRLADLIVRPRTSIERKMKDLMIGELQGYCVVGNL